MKTINWSVVCPAGGPAPVEAARKSVAALHAKVDQTRSEVESAQAAVREAEEADQAQMARALRAGKEPVSSTEKVEALRAAAAEAERRAGALALAIAQAEAELGEAINRSRGKWASDAVARVDTARESARRSLDELERSVSELRDAQAVADWLGRGFDSAQPLRTVHVGIAASSRSASANSDPFDLGQLLAWVREAVEPPAPTMPVEHRPLGGPAPEAFSDAPVAAA